MGGERGQQKQPRRHFSSPDLTAPLISSAPSDAHALPAVINLDRVLPGLWLCILISML